MARVIPDDPPRPYTDADARRDRPWRPAPTRIGVECVVIGGALMVLGLATQRSLGLYAGGIMAAAGVAAWLLGARRVYARWAALVREGQKVQGQLGHAQPLVLIHELLKPPQERTSILHYEFPGPDGERRYGKVLICSCVRDRLPPNTPVDVVVDPADPKRSVPLPLALMVAHKR